MGIGTMNTCLKKTRSATLEFEELSLEDEASLDVGWSGRETCERKKDKRIMFIFLPTKNNKNSLG